ncbi:MAG TPA: class I SAM-dependent methyltransferase [Solirubrobacterales bacterium]|nr:class I SAM-dependent methyltransferase [Solirubrobacterales bacterium]
MARDDFYASPLGAAYSAYMERPWLSRAIGRLLWGGDSGRYYESMNAVAEVPDGGTAVDCPCGAGPAFRAVPADSAIRYVAADLSPSMLRRARKRARLRGLTGLEILKADATALPLPAASADLFLSFWGLHCYDDPAGALAEAARVLKPAGRLVGASFVRGDESLRQRLLIKPGVGAFGQVGTQQELEDWLAAEGFGQVGIERSGPMLFFEATASA